MALPQEAEQSTQNAHPHTNAKQYTKFQSTAFTPDKRVWCAAWCVSEVWRCGVRFVIVVWACGALCLFVWCVADECRCPRAFSCLISRSRPPLLQRSTPTLDLTLLLSLPLDCVEDVAWTGATFDEVPSRELEEVLYIYVGVRFATGTGAGADELAGVSKQLAPTTSSCPWHPVSPQGRRCRPPSDR